MNTWSIQRIRESFKTNGAARFALLCLRLPVSPLLRSYWGGRAISAYHGWLFDRRFGVDTSGWISQPIPSSEASNPRLGSAYDGSIPLHFNRIVENLNISYEHYAFVDFGSGKGRVLLLAAAFPFRRVAGVEWSRELHDVARRNLDVYNGPRVCSEAECFCMDARDFPIPEGKSVLYFFNPFKDEITARVLQNIRRSFEANPREIILLYMNPRFKRVLERAGFLEKTVDRGWFAVYRTISSPVIGQQTGAMPAGVAAK